VPSENAVTDIRIDQSYISGHWITPENGESFTLYEPATGAGAGQALLCSETELDDAVMAAKGVLSDGWGENGLVERIGYLKKLVKILTEEQDSFARCIAFEVGAPRDFAVKQQVGTAIGHLKATLAAAQGLELDVTPNPAMPEHRERFEPAGVAGLITPWNWPLNQIALKFGAALIAGCPMILKPSEYTPRTSVLFAQCVDRIGLPRGVFSMVLGNGRIGSAMTSHKGIRVISFTGSTSVGRQIATAAAQDFKRVILELGGKSPNILFEDCDVDTAVRQGLAHCFRNAGQSCNAASLMLVQAPIYDRVVDLAAEVARETQLGLPQQGGLHLGPVISKAQFDRVQTLIGSALDQGARLVAGGQGRVEGFGAGYYVKPTVFADVTLDMRIAQEEVFGPVQSIVKFATEEDAIAMANSQDHGLAAYIQTGDPVRADRVARRLDVGMVQVNGNSRLPGAPFGGTKSSGIGRESGIWGIREYLEIKSISGAARQSDT
jgi:aldehyde dehydrogenase (NAD+)